jgi:hypothetical protein
VFCEGLVDNIRKEELWWEYSVELANADALEVDAGVLRVLELELRAAVQDDLLSCEDPKRRRRLAGSYGISALDYNPEDVLLTDQGEFSLMVINQFQTKLD